MADETTETPTTQTEAIPTSTESTATTATAGEGAGATTQQETPASTQTTEGERPASETKTGTETTTVGAPEKYDFKATEGKEYDATVLESFSDAAKVANLTQETAQTLLDTMAPKIAERFEQQRDALSKQWADEAKNDKDFGGDKLQENLALAKKALETYGDDATRTLLDNSGLGNNLGILRMLAEVGKSISEDKVVTGQPGGGSQPDWSKVMYDNTPSK